MLTEKQEKYVYNLVFGGMSQRKAYRDAYGNETATDKTIDERASKLLKNDKVKKRYDQLKCEKEGIEFFDLTKKEETFVELLVLGDSQYEAYKKAFNCSNWKRNTIDSKASVLRKKEKIEKRYQYLKKRVLAAVEQDTIMSAEEAMRELTKIARADIMSVLEIKKSGDEMMTALKEGCDTSLIKDIYIDKNGNIRVQLHDKLKAASKLLDVQMEKDENGEQTVISVVGGKEWAE